MLPTDREDARHPGDHIAEDDDWTPDPTTEVELNRIAAVIGPVLRESSSFSHSETPAESERLNSLLNRLKEWPKLAPDQSDSFPFVPDSDSEKSNLESEQDLPEVFGNFRRVRLHARGGMGIVYLAKHLYLNYFAALKVIRPERLASPTARKRFIQENSVIARVNQLQHSSLLKTFDSNYEHEFPYLATEFVHGLTISEVLARSGPMQVPVATEIIRQVAEGLSLAHSAGVVHRDIKPSNIMLTADGTARILDFGLALWDDDENSASDISESNQIVGTLDYMAPEQLRHSRAASTCSDIYSLGATLFRMLTGKLPLPTETTNSRAERIAILLEGESRSLSEYCSEAPAELTALVDRMLSQDVAARPQSASEVARSLELFASRLALIQFASQVIPPPTDEIPVTLWTPETKSDAVEPQVTSKKPWPWKVAVVVIALCGIVFAAIANWNQPAAVTPSFEPSSSANTESRESTSDVLPNKDAAAEHPVSVSWNPEEFASAGPEDVSEPPPLEEWLIGKKVITVKQDGTGDYRTIFEACQRRQPGEVVEVLDVGPYVENLKMMPMPPGSGLFSRVGTVIIPAQWDVKNTKKASSNRDVLNFFLHGLGQSPDFRLSGFNFHWESILDAQPFGIFASGDLLIENCAFLQLGHTTQGGGHRPPNMRIYRAAVDTASAARVVVRDCVFAALLRIQFSINSPTKLLVTRNFFRSADSHWRLWLYLDNVEAREHEFLIQQNVIQGEDSTVLVGPPMTPARIVFDRNTFLSKAGYPVLQVNSSETEPDNTQMAAIRNVVFGPPNSWLTSSLKNAKQVRFNVVPAVHPDFEASLQCVTRFTPSLDVGQPDYMRLIADSPVGRALRTVGSNVVPGALAMHEPGRAEDWFDRLRLRWVEQMKLNEQLAEQLRAVPRQ